MAFAICAVLHARDPAAGSRRRRAGRRDVVARPGVLRQRPSRRCTAVRSGSTARVRARPFGFPAVGRPVACRLRRRPAAPVPLGLDRVPARTAAGATRIACPATVLVAPDRSVPVAVRRTPAARLRLGPPHRTLTGGSGPRRIVTAPAWASRAALVGDPLTSRTPLWRIVFGIPRGTSTLARTRFGRGAAFGLPPGSRGASGASRTVDTGSGARMPRRTPTVFRRRGGVRASVFALLASRPPPRRAQRYVVPISRCATVFRAGQAGRVGLDAPLVVVGRPRARPGLDRVLRIHHPLAVARGFAPVADRWLVLTCHLRSPRQCLGNTRVFRQDHPAAE